MPTLEQRLAPILEWFKDCLAVEETIVNLNRELEPLDLIAHLDDRIVVIRRIPAARDPKPVARPRSRVGAIEVQL